MANYVVVNDGVDTGTVRGYLSPAVQGQTGLTMTIDVQDQAGNAYAITGAGSFVGRMQLVGTSTVTTVSGTLAESTGDISWPVSSGDIGTAGIFLVLFQFTISGSVIKTYPVQWEIIADPAATAVQNQAVIGVATRNDWVVHIPGTLSANINSRWEVPAGCKVSHISAVASNDSDATITFGISTDTDSILASTAIGDTNVPIAFTAVDWDAANPTGALNAGDIAVLTVDFDGSSGTAADDLTVIITTTSEVISLAGSVEDVSDLTATGFSADDLAQWNGTSFVNVAASSIGGGLSNVVEDLTPQAGGDFDLNGNTIVDATATKGQQLTYNEAETGAEWGLASKYLSARKGSAGTITAGTPVYISGYNLGQTSIEVEIADQSDPAKMPAVGLAFDSITNAANTRVLLSGSLVDVDTSGYSQKDSLYVAAAAGANLPWLTATKPTTGAIQKVATVSRSNASNGSLIVTGAGRANDIPNFSAASKFWASDSAAATADEKDITDFALTILDDTDAATVRGTIGAASLRPAYVDESSTARTFGLTDEDKVVRSTNGSATVFTVPLNSSVAFATYTVIGLEWGGVGELSVAATGGVTINSANGYLKLSVRYAQAALIKTDTNVWTLVGALKA